MNHVKEPLLRPGMELVHAVPVASSLESYLFFKAAGKPHCLHDLPKHPQLESLHSSPRYTLYPCPHIIPLDSSLVWGTISCIPLNNSHLLNATCQPLQETLDRHYLIHTKALLGRSY